MAESKRTRLTADDVRAMRARYDATANLPQRSPGRVTVKQIVAEFDVARVAAWKIVTRKSWKGVEPRSHRSPSPLESCEPKEMAR